MEPGLGYEIHLNQCFVHVYVALSFRIQIQRNNGTENKSVFNAAIPVQRIWLVGWLVVLGLTAL